MQKKREECIVINIIKNKIAPAEIWKGFELTKGKQISSRIVLLQIQPVFTQQKTGNKDEREKDTQPIRQR